jgi:hypothetical protein
MHGHILYYPTIEFQSDTWLKCALCLWESIYRIVPPSYAPQDSDEVREAIDAGLVQNINLTGDDLSECAGHFEEFWKSVPEMPLWVSGRDPVNLYEEKVDDRLIPLFRSLAEKFPKDGVLQVSKEIADTYVLFLADTIARRRAMEKLTDDKDVFALTHYFANNGDFNEFVSNPEAREASLAITFPALIPGGLEYVSMAKVLAFRDKHREGRGEFRVSIDDFVAALTKVDDEEHAHTLIREFADRLQRENGNWLTIVKREFSKVAMSSLSVGLPAALTAMGTMISSGSSIKDAPTYIGSVAVGCVATLANTMQSRRQAWTARDSFYYAQMRNEFGDGKLQFVVPRYTQAFDEFMND